MTKHPVRRDVHCCKPAPWTAYEGICIQPIGHEKRCKFMAAEFVEVRK